MKFHTNLPVLDLHRTIEFYTALFASRPVKVRDDYAKFLPESLPINISFHQPKQGGQLPLTDLHLGFELPSQEALDEAYERMSKAGWVVEERETSVCCYANQDKFWIADPNGYRWELYFLVADVDAKSSAPAKGSCCGDQCAPGAADCC